MKVAVSTYSFNRMLIEGTLNQLTCIEKAKELGYDGIEIVEITPHDESTQKEYAKKLADEAERVGLPIVHFSFSADFINGNDGNLQEQIEYVKEMIDIAEILDVKSVRHDATWGYVGEVKRYKGMDQALPELVEGCRVVTEYAATKGIRTTVENHGFFCQDSDRVERLVTEVAHPNFGLLVDMGNFLCADEDPVKAVSRVAAYASFAHIKDFHIKSGMGPNPGEGFFKSRGGNYLRGAIVGHGDVPVKQCLSILKQAGYDDFVTIEFEGIEENIKALKIGLENTKRYISEL